MGFSSLRNHPRDENDGAGVTLPGTIITGANWANNIEVFIRGAIWSECRDRIEKTVKRKLRTIVEGGQYDFPVGTPVEIGVTRHVQYVITSIHSQEADPGRINSAIIFSFVVERGGKYGPILPRDLQKHRLALWCDSGRTSSSTALFDDSYLVRGSFSWSVARGRYRGIEAKTITELAREIFRRDTDPDEKFDNSILVL